MDILTLKLAFHENSPQSFSDFIVSDRSLYAELCERGYDRISCLDWMGEPADTQGRARLVLEESGDLSDGRVALYICPECGDLDCGAITVAIRREGKEIVWETFAYEVPFMDQFTAIGDLGPFRFQEDQYRAAINKRPGY